MTLCKDCEHFKIMQQPIKGFDWGMAECTKYDLVVDFADRRKFKWLSCEDRPKNGEPNHDRDWIVGCIKHDGFIQTDRGDKANQIILEALEADTVEVVRCKDCKHWKWIEWAKEYRCTLRNTAFNAREDDFCSFGERREE